MITTTPATITNEMHVVQEIGSVAMTLEIPGVPIIPERLSLSQHCVQDNRYYLSCDTRITGNRRHMDISSRDTCAFRHVMAPERCLCGKRRTECELHGIHMWYFP